MVLIHLKKFTIMVSKFLPELDFVVFNNHYSFCHIPLGAPQASILGSPHYIHYLNTIVCVLVLAIVLIFYKFSALLQFSLVEFLLLLF